MSGDLVMVHTVAALADLFDELRAEIDPDVPVRHVVQAALLTDAIDAGALTDEIKARTRDALLEAAEGACVVLCTCSTVGPGADDAAAEARVPILRVDRPMAEAAVEAGRRITVAATLATTIGPTADLVADAARRAGREVEIRLSRLRRCARPAGGGRCGGPREDHRRGPARGRVLGRCHRARPGLHDAGALRIAPTSRSRS